MANVCVHCTGTSLECHSFFFFFFFSSFFSSSSSELLLLLLLSESESLLESLLLESRKRRNHSKKFIKHFHFEDKEKEHAPEEDSSFLAFLADSFGSSVFLFITVVLLSRCTYLGQVIMSIEQISSHGTSRSRIS